MSGKLANSSSLWRPPNSRLPPDMRIPLPYGS